MVKGVPLSTPRTEPFRHVYEGKAKGYEVFDKWIASVRLHAAIAIDDDLAPPSERLVNFAKLGVDIVDMATLAYGAGKLSLKAASLTKSKILLRGTAPKSNIQLAQKGVRRTFTTVKEGSNFKYAGWKISDVAKGLRNGTISPNDFPIEYVVIKGEKFAVNNRSLTALRRAGLEPTVTKNVTNNAKSLRRVKERLKEIDDLGFPRDATTIRGRDGVFSSID